MAEVIRVLPRDVANRINAGEVVERPASVVKELVENALDAGATRLELELEEGGTRLIRLRDDGAGMSAGDLTRCVLPHATSKIASVEDLFRVASFGFRGEALPSIASVSELTITTRPKDEEAQRLRCRGEESEGPHPVGAPPGTCVEVRNLFHQVPVRRKFLKSPRAEYSRCLEMITRLLLPEIEVELRLSHNGKKGLVLEAVDSLRERLGTLFGEKLAASLLEAEREEEGLQLRALIGPPELVKASGRMQYVYLNGRYIKDRGLAAALREAYRGLIMPKDHPVAFLFLEMDPGLVDVNVHPTKTEVRFRSRDAVFSLIHRCVKDRLHEARADRPARIRPAAQPGVARERPPRRQDLLGTIEAELFPSDAPAVASSASASAAAPLPASESVVPSAPSAPAASTPASASGKEACSAAPTGHETPRPAPAPAPRGGRRKGNACSSKSEMRPRLVPRGAAGSGGFIQIHRSYLVVESEDGLRIVDQHALHERKLYEELLDRFRRSEAEDQHLLIPEVVELGRADQALLLEHEDELAELGLKIEAFGGTSICLRSLPFTLRNLAPGEAVEEVLEVLRESGSLPKREQLIAEIVANLACRAAVKFNDRLPDEEIRQLLAWQEKHPEARNCPHGRPVSIGLNLRELEDQFQRKK